MKLAPDSCNDGCARAWSVHKAFSRVLGQKRRRSFVAEGLARPLQWLASHLQWLASPLQRARAVRRGSCRILLGSRSDPIAPSARRTIAKWTQTRVYWSVGSRRIPLGSCRIPLGSHGPHRTPYYCGVNENKRGLVGRIPSDPVGSRSDPIGPIARHTIVEWMKTSVAWSVGSRRIPIGSRHANPGRLLWKELAQEPRPASYYNTK